jgi:putative transport protein
MTWITSLLSDTTTSGILVGVAVSGAVGMLLGSIKIRGISLGVAGVLFAGIAWDLLVWGEHTQGQAHNPTIEFLREFGLILFVYAIGLTVGPGFFDRLKSQGLRWNLLAALIVFLGCSTTALFWWLMSLPGGLAVGLLSGAVTNTPSLAAAGQALGQTEGAQARIDLAAAGYAIAYPLGIVGIISTLLLLRPFARKEPVENHSSSDLGGPLGRMTLEVVNPGAVGLTIQQLRQEAGGKVIISRLARRGELLVPRGDVSLEAADVLLGVGAPGDLAHLRTICGAESQRDLLAARGDMVIRHLLVSSHAVSLKRLADLDPLTTHGVTVTRVTRAGVELLATDQIELHRGDRLRVVGSTEATERFAKVIGDSPRDLEKPELLPILIGILLGVVIGSIPIALPGMPAPLKLGLAGGPLLVGLLIASRGRLGPVDIFLPSPSIHFMRELGIILFLASVGLLSGEAFLRTLQRPDGYLLIALGAAITVVPLIITGFIALLWMRRPYGEIAGLLAGAMTDPPALAFAQATTGSEAPARIYSTVYPLTMLLRIASAQALMLLWP